MKFHTRRPRLAAAALLALCATYSLSAAAQNTTTLWVATMNIDPNNNATVLPDQQTMPDGSVVFRERYWDWRVSPSEAGSPDYCVQGDAFSTGDTHLVLNRRMPDGTLCAAALSADSTSYPNGVEGRAYQLKIEHAGACTSLGVPLDPVTSGCSVTTVSGPAAGMPQVHAAALFKSRATRVGMTFYFALANDSDDTDLRRYQLKMDGDVPVTMNAINSKTVESTNGTATLSQDHNGRYRPVARGIPMRFRILFERVPVP